MSGKNVVRLKITLKGTKPPVWRRLLIPEDVTMRELHEILNEAMGWSNTHLHDFEVAGQKIADTEADGFDDGWMDPKPVSEDKITLKKVMKLALSFDYTYDFGDDWVHRVQIEGVEPAIAGEKYPVCLAGKGACPPEDSGGRWGFENFKAAMADRNHPEHEERMEWYGGEFDPSVFSIDEFNLSFDRRTLVSGSKTKAPKSAAMARPGMRMTVQAKTHWERVPKELRLKLLNNAYCMECRDSTGIAEIDGIVSRGNLVLRGKCTSCGNPVARLIETSDLLKTRT